MEDGLVSSRTSSNEGGGTENRPAPLYAYTNKFYEVFPYYLAIGMTYEQFWEQDCELVKYYRKAAEIRQNLKNQDAWLQGAYFYEALADVAPIFRSLAKKGTRATPYRSEPYEFRGKEKRKEKADERAKAYMTAFAATINKRFQQKGGETDGRQCNHARSGVPNQK